MRPRRNRFGQEVDAGATLALAHGWRAIRCTGPCAQLVAVFEVPYGYLDDPEFGPYVCGDCRGVAVALSEEGDSS